MFESVGIEKFTAVISSNTRPLIIEHHSSFYNLEKSGLFLVNNQLGFLEITLFEGNIAALADIKEGNDIEIRF
jgi:S-adenosylmethionine hydrolase